MPKILGFIRRRPDFTLAAFSHYWRTTHSIEAMKLTPWLKGYVQNHFLPGPIVDVHRPADGSPVLWVDDPGAIADMIASEAFRTGAYLDEPRFMEGRSSGLVVTEEQLRVGRGPIKLMLFAGLVTTTKACDIWPVAHACGHVRNHALPDQAIDPGFAFDFVDEIWWPDSAAFEADRAAALPLSAMPGIVPHRLKAAMVDEIEMIPPPQG